MTELLIGVMLFSSVLWFSILIWLYLQHKPKKERVQKEDLYPDKNMAELENLKLRLASVIKDNEDLKMRIEDLIKEKNQCKQSILSLAKLYGYGYHEKVWNIPRPPEK